MSNFYVVRPITVEALRIMHTNVTAVAKWCGGRATLQARLVGGRADGADMWVDHPDWASTGHLGDWVVRYADGKYHLMTNTDFQNTFMPEEPYTYPKILTLDEGGHGASTEGK